MLNNWIIIQFHFCAWIFLLPIHFYPNLTDPVQRELPALPVLSQKMGNYSPSWETNIQTETLTSQQIASLSRILQHPWSGFRHSIPKSGCLYYMARGSPLSLQTELPHPVPSFTTQRVANLRGDPRGRKRGLTESQVGGNHGSFHPEGKKPET